MISFQKSSEWDEYYYNDWIKVNRLENFLAWALLNREYAYDANVLAPNGVLYCSYPCARFANEGEEWIDEQTVEDQDEGWQEGTCIDISGSGYWELYYGAGINPECNEYCPYCGLHYRSDAHFGLKKKEVKKHKIVQEYIANRKKYEAYPEPWFYKKEEDGNEKRDTLRPDVS